MNRTYYKKVKKKNVKRNLRIVGLGTSILGLLIVFYIFAPLVSFQLFYAPIFASQKIIAPVPPMTVSTPESDPILAQQSNNNVDYTNAQNWFPKYATKSGSKPKTHVLYYTLTIPKIRIKNALVSAVDSDLSLHMINFPGTAVPPDN